MLNGVLKGFQKDSIEFAIKNPYCILGLEQGLGKTLVSLCVSEKLKTKTLVVCPAYLRLNWKRESNYWFPDRNITVFESAKDIYYPFDSDIVVISYELLDKAELLFSWAKLVVTDEAQMLKNMKAKRTNFFHQIVYEYSIPRVILLTGTPIKNRVYEFYSLIAICNYNPIMEESAFLKKFPTYVDFANHFSFLKEFEKTVNQKRVKIQQWEGLQNVEELKTWLKNIYIRYEAKNVLDLPERIYKNVLVEEIDDEELLWAFESGQYDGVSADIKAKAALRKVPFTVKYVEDLLESVDQVVVYSDHVGACIAIAEYFGITPITGDTPIKVRDSLGAKFQNGESRIIVATIPSFSTGVTLTASHNMVFNDYCWGPGDLAQAEGRIVRIGQKRTCVFHRILGSNQDEYILKKVQEKTGVINKAVNWKK